LAASTKALGESYFGRCERDEGGHCMPSGQRGADLATKPEKPSEESAQDRYNAGYEQLQEANELASEESEKVRDAEARVDFWPGYLRTGGANEGYFAQTAELFVNAHQSRWDRVGQLLRDAGATDKDMTKYEASHRRGMAKIAKAGEAYLDAGADALEAHAAWKEAEARQPDADDEVATEEWDDADYGPALGVFEEAEERFANAAAAFMGEVEDAGEVLAKLADKIGDAVADRLEEGATQ
jgi:hypothetical protein